MTYKVAVIGHGYWGKNIARVFSQSQEFDLTCICDSNASALKRAAKIYPQAKLVAAIDDIPQDVDVVAIVTPVRSHYALAKNFLRQKKHVWITKPFTCTAAEAQELVDLARSVDRRVFVDHTFVFHPAVRKLKEMLPRIGTPYFVVSQRMNLGLYQSDVNVAYDLLPHDVSILTYVLDTEIVSSQNIAHKAAGMRQEDFAHSSFQTANGVFGTVTVSWLSPFKIRQFIIVGSDGMLSYDDTLVTEKVKFFDRGVKSVVADGSAPSRIDYRNGDLYSPAIHDVEALGFELEEFNKCLQDPKTAAYYDDLNLRVMRGLDLMLTESAKRPVEAA